ncbi:hypothetical protein FHG87_012288 [Trinorchestia longiramus]|nr:hypothetical protein FHG87_012288 [Trinorchestia longiramus]
MASRARIPIFLLATFCFLSDFECMIIDPTFPMFPRPKYYPICEVCTPSNELLVLNCDATKALDIFGHLSSCEDDMDCPSGTCCCSYVGTCEINKCIPTLPMCVHGSDPHFPPFDPLDIIG